MGASLLYHYVDGREGILRSVRDLLTEDLVLEESELDSDDWESVITVCARALWRAYAKHPAALLQLLPVPASHPEAIRVYTVMIEALRKAGVADGDLIATADSVDFLALGSAFDVLILDQWIEDGAASAEILSLVNAQPRGIERSRVTFERGLGLILSGIRAELR